LESESAFDVHVYEKAVVAGGVSTAEDVGGGLWINDGVQVWRLELGSNLYYFICIVEEKKQL